MHYSFPLAYHAQQPSDCRIQFAGTLGLLCTDHSLVFYLYHSMVVEELVPFELQVQYI